MGSVRHAAARVAVESGLRFNGGGASECFETVVATFGVAGHVASGIAVESDMRCNCAKGRSGLTSVIAAARVAGHVSASVPIEGAVGEGEIREAIVAANSMIEHIPTRVPNEVVDGVHTTGKGVVAPGGVIANVLTRIADKKVGCVREANQNVIGTHLMVNETPRNNWNALGHEHLPLNVPFFKCKPACRRKRGVSRNEPSKSDGFAEANVPDEPSLTACAAPDSGAQHEKALRRIFRTVSLRLAGLSSLSDRSLLEHMQAPWRSCRVNKERDDA
ncbi:hypothetical protein ABIB00_000809 [Bradyrhizobium sp. LB14.3]